MTTPSRPLRLSALVFLALAACSDADTVLALTIKSGSDIGVVTQLRVTVTPSSGTGAPMTTEFAPPVDPNPDAGGVISPSFFRRMTIPGNPGGDAFVTVEALNTAGAVFAVGATTAQLRSHGITTAAVTLMPGTRLPIPDAGTDGAPDAGSPSDGATPEAASDAAIPDDDALTGDAAGG